MKTRLAPASKLRQGAENLELPRSAEELASLITSAVVPTRSRLLASPTNVDGAAPGTTDGQGGFSARAFRGTDAQLLSALCSSLRARARAPEVTHLRWGPHFSGGKLSWLLQQVIGRTRAAAEACKLGVRYDRFTSRQRRTSRHVRAVCLRLECCVHACLSRLGALIGDADAGLSASCRHGGRPQGRAILKPDAAARMIRAGQALSPQIDSGARTAALAHAVCRAGSH